MSEHRWGIREIYLAGLPVGIIWICPMCGATAGQWDVEHPNHPVDPVPFLAGTPLCNLSLNCEEAEKQIDEYVEKYPAWNEYVGRTRAVRAG
jgi:hypothetical protein